MRGSHRHSLRSASSSWSVKRTHRSANPFGMASAKFWWLAAFLMLVFAMGGSARGDIESLIILRPVSAMILGISLTSLKWEQVRTYRWLFALAAGCITYTVLLNPLTYASAEFYPYVTASLPAAAAAGLVYFLCSRLVIRARRGGYPA